MAALLAVASPAVAAETAAPAASEETAAESVTPELVGLWSNLTDSDKTLIRTAGRHTGSALTTTRDTPNAAFWTALEARGLMQSVPLSQAYAENAVPAMEAAGFRIFQVTEKGSNELPALLQTLTKP